MSVPATSEPARSAPLWVDLLSKLWPVLLALGSVAIWVISNAYAQQINNARYDTLVQERGDRNAQTRADLSKLREDFETEKTANAEFRGRTDASLTAIKEALQIEREDRKDKAK